MSESYKVPEPFMPSKAERDKLHQRASKWQEYVSEREERFKKALNELPPDLDDQWAAECYHEYGQAFDAELFQIRRRLFLCGHRIPKTPYFEQRPDGSIFPVFRCQDPISFTEQAMNDRADDRQGALLADEVAHYNEILTRRAVLLLCFADTQTPLPQRLLIFHHMLIESAGWVYNLHREKKALVFDAPYGLADMAGSIAQLSGFKNKDDQVQGNRLRASLSRFAEDSDAPEDRYERLFIEMRARIKLDRMPAKYEPGDGIGEISNKATNEFCLEHPAQPRTVSLQQPESDREEARTIEETYYDEDEPDATFEAISESMEFQSNLSDALRALADRKRKVEMTGKLKHAGYTDEEIAGLLGESKHATRKRIVRYPELQKKKLG
jgi:hypothetical protein